VADASAAVMATGLDGTLDALRGGTYVVDGSRVRFKSARVVRDAVVDGVKRGARARLRVHGRGVPRAQLTLRFTRRTTRITGTVAGRHVGLRVPAAS
jgi:hypothetical protein